MKFSRARFRIYLDIIIFICMSITCSISMVMGIAINDHILKPSVFFVLIYLINLIFYRIFKELELNGYSIKAPIIRDSLTALCMLCLISTIMLIVYLVYFAAKSLWGNSFVDIFSNHVLYATIVGSILIIHLALDNITTYFNLYTKK